MSRPAPTPSGLSLPVTASAAVRDRRLLRRELDRMFLNLAGLCARYALQARWLR